ncbi:MAG: alpha/beta hydrolase [Phycisphaeraceae bacterium]|nr:alpha/beta hydrolase [Phycisphaeraceae bacterium]
MKSIGLMIGIGALALVWPLHAQPTRPKPKKHYLWPKDAGLAEPKQRVKTKRNVLRLTDIDSPYLTVYPADSDSPTPAMIVCPGGGYGHVCMDKEGSEAEPWLSKLGVTTIVLAYSTPGKRDEAFKDVRRAIRLVRHNAEKWNIAPKRVGVMGFSAGGHLAARLSTEFEVKNTQRIDAIDDLNARPDFCVLVYPAYLLKKGNLALPVNEKTPPTLIVHTEDDRRFIAGSKLYFEALQKKGVMSRFLLFKKGGHGYGMRAKKEPLASWTRQCGQWLKANVLEKKR